MEKAAKKALKEINSKTLGDKEDFDDAVEEIVSECDPYEEGDYKIYVADTLVMR